MKTFRLMNTLADMFSLTSQRFQSNTTSNLKGRSLQGVLKPTSLHKTVIDENIIKEQCHHQTEHSSRHFTDQVVISIMNACQ